jgi:hypothetical protein
VSTPESITAIRGSVLLAELDQRDCVMPATDGQICEFE